MLRSVKAWMLLVVLAAIACKKSATKPRDAGPATAVTADAAMTTDAPLAPADATASGLVARIDGVGPLDAKTVASEQVLAQQFPGYEVKAVSIDHGGDLREEYVGVSKAGALVLRVQRQGERLTAVDVVSADVETPFRGVKVGATHAEVVAALGPLDCEDAGETTDWRANIVACTTPAAATYTFDFAHAEADIYSAKKMLADPAKLARAKLVALTWEPST